MLAATRQTQRDINAQATFERNFPWLAEPTREGGQRFRHSRCRTLTAALV